MEGRRQRKSRFELFPESLPKGVDKSSISVENNGHQEAIMFPHMFKEELIILLCCRSLLAWYEYSHLGKSVNYYYYRVMLMFGSRMSHQVVHGNKFPWSTRNWKGCVQSLSSIRWFSNGTNHARPNVLVEVRFK